MSNIPTSPFVTKTADEILGEILEQIVAGIVPISHEEHTYISGTNTYTLTCGNPDIDGQLIEVNRIWGTKDDSFKEFIENNEFTVDLTNNQITFTDAPDDQTIFNVSYKYDQQKTSGITDISEGSVIWTLASSIARNMASAYRSLELIKAAAYIETAQGDDLDELLKLVGITRNAATVASGYVTFYRETDTGDSEVPNGTQVIANTPDGNIVYQTTTSVWFRDGFTSVRAPVEALSLYAGINSNMAPNKITQLAGAAGGASKVNNPQYYTDYEFTDLVEGLYTYELDNPPRRVINSKGFVGTYAPWDVTDRGMIAVWNFRDIAMETANYTTNNVTLTQDTPESGQLRCVPSTSVDAYITRTFVSNLSTYEHVFLMIRGTEDDTFQIQINGSTATMYEFASTSSSTSPSANANWTLYCGAHGLTATSTSTFKIIFNSTNTFWVDFIGIGKELEEVHGSAMTSEDQAQVNYTGKQLGFWYSSETQNFFQKWDGDDADGVTDYCFVYYQWSNNISGGGDEESDELLRYRGRNALDVAAKGTKDAIINAVLDIDGISQCEVADYNDDSTIDPGVCHVYVLARGFTISPALNQEIVDTIEDVRAAGIQVKIFAPQVRYSNFTLNVVYDDSISDYVGSAGQAVLQTLIESVIDDFFANISINDALYFADLIGDIINGVSGVVSAYVTWDDATEPTVSDDDYSGSYAYDADIVKDEPQRISGQKTGATIVVQRGNNITFNFYRMSEKR